MCYKAKVPVCSEIHTKHINAMWAPRRIFNLVVREVTARIQNLKAACWSIWLHYLLHHPVTLMLYEPAGTFDANAVRTQPINCEQDRMEQNALSLSKWKICLFKVISKALMFHL
jgi:hypothetical protein